MGQALHDAGCPPDDAAHFLEMQERGDDAGQLALLQTQRRRIVDTIRTAQSCLDCLDYLLYQFR